MLRQTGLRALSACRSAAGVRALCSATLKPAQSVPATIRADGSLAVVFGGFGFNERQLRRHVELYSEHGFEVMPVISSIKELVTPASGWRRGPIIAGRRPSRPDHHRHARVPPPEPRDLTADA